MTQWPNKPLIYQLNTAVWLTSLSEQYQAPITLANVPDEVLDYLASLNVNVIWLMGIWQRSEAARQSALNYTHEYKPVLPDLTEDDVIGSAFAVGAYEVDNRFGGRKALAALRERLQARNLRLILDYVPNHVATDHLWVIKKPHYMVRGTLKDVKNHPGMFFPTTNSKGQTYHVAHGRDPYFPSWIDTAQVNAFSPEYRAAALEVLLDIAAQCDGVRCDMAMLMVSSIFNQTWGAYLMESAPNVEFWEEIIPAVKAKYPDFVFAAEVYWDMEYQLQQQGFDYTYDKLLHDRLLDVDVNQTRMHLTADMDYQLKMVRFIENHDEQRAADTIGIEKQRAAATIICTIPGATLLHDGQLTGRRMKLPMQIGRQPHQQPHGPLERFYKRLLAEANQPVYEHGEWLMLDLASLGDHHTDGHHNLIAYSWRLEDEIRVIVVNMTHIWSQGRVYLPGWGDLRDVSWQLRDALSGAHFYHDGNVLQESGLSVELEPFQSYIFVMTPVTDERLLSVVRSNGHKAEA